MRRRFGKPHSSHERWLISYADFITLLFAFFVVLYAFAKADQKRQTEVSQAIDTAFKSLGVFGNASRIPDNKTASSANEQSVMAMNIVMGEDVLAPAQVKDDLTRMKHDLDERLASQIAQHSVAIKLGKDGLVISLREAGFFDSGSATPRKEGLESMQQIASELAQMPYDLRVEGHTDNVPIHTAEFASNWELSSARATNIARGMLDLHAVTPDRLSAAGYAEFHPVDTNDTAEGRARNRRVDLVISPRTKINLALNTAQPTGEWRKITDDDVAAKTN
ncbi:flagellar motor protein MotB [Terracidiphilus gabretensis]|uniref:flagellar motor protein MotB n=1 Tax=Terracidiphilus gabretensis TaxID=1577687 RepID=UPI00071B889D|nr:flagellar motor protein MotB [Terracidiphilus gabretensis]